MERESLLKHKYLDLIRFLRSAFVKNKDYLFAPTIYFCKLPLTACLLAKCVNKTQKIKQYIKSRESKRNFTHVFIISSK